MNEIIRAIRQRRSIRQFLNQKVPHELLEEIVAAGLYAPSSMGKQQTCLLAIEEETVIARLSRLNVAVSGHPDSDPFYGARTLIVVLATKENRKGVEDGSLVMQNMMLAAHSLGLGSCWIHRAKEVMESEYGQELLSRYLPEGEYQGIANLVIGYPTRYPEADKRLGKRVFYL